MNIGPPRLHEIWWLIFYWMQNLPWWAFYWKRRVTGAFSSQRSSNAENAFIWWRHHGFPHCSYTWGFWREWANIMSKVSLWNLWDLNCIQKTAYILAYFADITVTYIGNIKWYWFTHPTFFKPKLVLKEISGVNVQHLLIHSKGNEHFRHIWTYQILLITLKEQTYVNQDDRHFPADILKWIFLNENLRFFIKISRFNWSLSLRGNW